MNVPLITVIIPHKKGKPVDDPPQGDETFWVNSGLGIGEARIKGSQQASHEWLVQTDADGRYPENYVEKIKDAIAGGKYPDGFWCVRKGGFQYSYLESGLVVRRDLFLSRTENFMSNHQLDIGNLFLDLPINNNIVYDHNLTTGEKRGLLMVGMMGIGLGLIYASVR